VSKTSYNNFKIGDLVIYAPYFEGEGAWVMSGDLGIVLGVRTVDNLQIIRVSWIDPRLGEDDMAAEVLVKLEYKDEDK
jgi:hypothetical protein